MSMIRAESSAPTSAGAVLTRGLWHENPVLVQTLGLCSALAVTNAVANSLAMGLATTFVLVGSSVIVSTLRRIIPHQIRITTYILIIATFLAIADMTLEALVPDVHKAMGPYIALIITNCIVLGRQEAFASRQPIALSVLDALGNGTGFTIALLLMGIPREVLGNGTFLGVQVMPHAFEPWVVMLLPPGGFFMIGVLLLVANWHGLRKLARERRAAPAAATVVSPPRTTEREREREAALV
ncbi:RnfA-Nqr electron transport subunit (plasmid) [Gemmatirosa kalamazoonensis]|uniref:Ion-translocating oxidoreductase complex subunit E n=1 Tax=Gemmatirosa kalamazoonensis TaxID=861299 RepID=W0RQ56_9BACT|nr:electron transport complex subunit RsxE [Gemmatirosa kalamazoonensis]AHG92612.1 RnfA-Nqr electron transport subunit [Gemmatirosa kalamazoonensis]